MTYSLAVDSFLVVSKHVENRQELLEILKDMDWSSLVDYATQYGITLDLDNMEPALNDQRFIEFLDKHNAQEFEKENESINIETSVFGDKDNPKKVVSLLKEVVTPFY